MVEQTILFQSVDDGFEWIHSVPDTPLRDCGDEDTVTHRVTLTTSRVQVSNTFNAMMSSFEKESIFRDGQVVDLVP